MANQPNLVLLRLYQFLAFSLLTLLGMFDVWQLFQRGVASDKILLQVVSAVAVAAVWLPEHKKDGRVLPAGAIVVGLGSLLLSGALTLDADNPTLWGSAESLALAGVLFVVARRSRPLIAAVAIVVIEGAIAAMPLRGGHSAIFVALGLVQALGGAVVVGAGVYLRSVESARQRAVDTVRSEQRAEFARDLHDFIAHHVTGIVVQAQGAKFIAEQDPKRVLLALEQIEQAGAETMASMRRMVGVLRDPHSRPDAPLAPIAGVNELPILVEQFTAADGAQARLHVDGQPGNLPVEVSTSAYRVVMEALTNVRQHAPEARVADVWIRRTPGWLLVRVANDGPPGRPPAVRDRPGYGLVGLTERVRAVGGRITAGPGIEGGWIVDAAFPIDAKAG